MKKKNTLKDHIYPIRFPTSLIKKAKILGLNIAAICRDSLKKNIEKIEKKKGQLN